VTYLFTDWNEEQAQLQISKTAKQSIRLRPYQLTAVDSVYDEWTRVRSTMLNMATGLGKSVCFAETMARWDVETQGKILLIAHRRELILQAIGHAMRAGLSSGIEMAGKHATGKEDVIVASVQTLNASRKCGICFGEGCDDCYDGKVKRFTRFNPRDFGLLVCDEFHHFTAKSNRNVMAWFAQNPLQKTLGVTATPRRADKAGLHNICQSVAYAMELRQAIDEGWLVPIRQKFVTVEGLDISKVDIRAGKLNEGQVEAAFLGTDEEEEKLLHAIVKPTIDEAAGRKTLVFAAGKDHANKLASCFAAHGVDAGVVVENTDPAERAELIARYSHGDLQVLVNCMVFTEGFDAPATEIIANCRPTKSEALYLQIIGRGTRPLAGVVDGPVTAEARKAAIEASDKKSCTILDFVGNSGDIKLVSVADVLAGDNIEPIDLAEALRVATETGETVDMEALAEKMKQSRLEAEERKEIERQQRLLTNTKADRADYSTVDVDLFGGPEFSSDAKYVEPISKGQQGFLYHQLGLTRKQTKHMSKRQASAIIGKTYKQAGDDWKRLIKEAGSAGELKKVGQAIESRKTSDYLMRDKNLVDSLRAAYVARKGELRNEQ
jgi:superfamily II DNA or RNA helicase